MSARQKKGLSSGSAALKAPQDVETTPSLRAVTGAVAGLAATWSAAGSLGLMAHPLRHALTWVALAVVVLMAWPLKTHGAKSWLLLAAGAIAAAMMTMSSLVVYNVLAVALVLALVASMQTGLDRRIFLIVALSAGCLGLYRFAASTIPTVWLIADRLGSALGYVAGSIVGQPLQVGASFGGLDWLVAMSVVYVGWLMATASPRGSRALAGLAAILVGQMLYLTLLSYAAELRAALPPPPPPPESDLYIPPGWSWSRAVASLLPWNLPIVGAVIQGAIAALMLRWAPWLPIGTTTEEPVGPAPKRPPVVQWAPWVLAAVIPLVTVASMGRGDLAGKNVLVYNKGNLNWVKPVFDQYGQHSAGAYGMLPTFVESLGGRLVRSDELTDAELAKADVLLLIHPMTPWPEALQKRVWDYVRRGGSLLVIAEPRVVDAGQTSAFDDLLAPTSLRVRFDTAMAINYKWEHSCAALAHPATTGARGEPNRYGLLRGPSLDVAWPARPMLIGQWGWSDPGSDAVMTIGASYETGERLGDLVLAAEQPLGRGRVVVLADSYGLKNEGFSTAYEFTARLLGYLAWRSGSPQALWRQALGLTACLLLIVLVARRPQPMQLALVVVLLGFSLTVATKISSSASRVLPNGANGKGPNHLAYIDASHVEAYNRIDWLPDDIMGLKLTLMRNGYLPLLLSDFSAEALDRAGVLIAIAPARAYSAAERQVVKDFVHRGGLFLCMAGAEHAGPIQPLLNEFGFHVPLCPRPVGDRSEAKPMGRFRGMYLTGQNDQDYHAELLVYTGWPIQFPRETTSLLVKGVDGVPVMACARFGKGKVLVIGDTCFAMNKNLEYVTGDPFEGRYDNAHFWRWLFTYLNDQPQWVPPSVPGEKPAGD
jgi:hypothetical protein